MEVNNTIGASKTIYKHGSLPERAMQTYTFRGNNLRFSTTHAKQPTSPSITCHKLSLRKWHLAEASNKVIENFELSPRKIYLWDLPIRIFHWTLVAMVLAAFITAKIGGDLMDIHEKCGITIIGLLAFRITWGFIGSTHARFKQFFYSPQTILIYLKGQWRGVGHNPLGSLSVFAMLGVLTIQAITGLFSNDDIAFDGPFIAYIEKDLSDRITSLHHLSSNILLGLIFLHIIAIIFYVSFKKDNLLKPMITGHKEVANGQSTTRSGLLSFVMALLLVFIVAYMAYGGKINFN